MTASYVAWNGESYPWPPPDGWYQAADGRWWAAGSGPNPPGAAPGAPAHQAGHAAPGGTPHGQAAQPAFPAQQAAQAPGPAATPAQGPPDLSGQPGLGQQQTVIAGGPAPGGPGYGGPAGAPPGGPNVPPTGAPAPAPPPNTPGPLPQATNLGGQNAWQSSSPSGGSKVPLIIGALALIGMIGLGAAFLLLRGDENTTAAGSTTTAAAPAETTDTAPLAPVTAETTLPPPTTVATTESTAPPVTLSDEESVARFRDILLANDLDSSALSDEDIISFGVSFCLLAILSEDMGDFVEFREETVAESDAELNDEELALVIDAVIVSFCPDEADRLGLAV